MKNIIITFITSLLLIGIEANADSSSILAKFNHQMHEEKVLPVLGVSCSVCHNFELGADHKTAKATPDLSTSAFRMSVKEICHQCHNTEAAQYRTVPKSCSICHADQAAMQKIRPKNHENTAWKNTHALNAEVASNTCFNCHITSQCVKCHTRRSDIELKNHSRNFRFTHSVIARAQPQKCDSCHVQTFCVRCHLGR
ncbi:MAG: cytochrome c3 family protein [Bdellovibrionota bacterium]